MEDLIIARDKVVTRWANISTSKVSGKQRVSAEITIDMIRDGKFAETWHMWSDKPWLK